jgi:hypothetical protein
MSFVAPVVAPAPAVNSLRGVPQLPLDVTPSRLAQVRFAELTSAGTLRITPWLPGELPLQPAGRGSRQIIVVPVVVAGVDDYNMLIHYFHW